MKNSPKPIAKTYILPDAEYAQREAQALDTFLGRQIGMPQYAIKIWRSRTAWFVLAEPFPVEKSEELDQWLTTHRPSLAKVTDRFNNSDEYVNTLTVAYAWRWPVTLCGD